MKNYWDKLAGRFNLFTFLYKVHPDAAVNIVFGWPTFFSIIKSQMQHLDKRKCNIIDYGCGTGKFCEELNVMGHTVIGLDRSPKMLEIATDKTSRQITYKELDLSISNELENEFVNKMQGTIDIITSMHCLDWISDKDVKYLLKNFIKLLNTDGIILFAVFPPKHVIESIKIKDLFEDFDSDINPKKGMANFDGIKVPVFVRDVKFYDNFFIKEGFEKELEYYPSISQSFVKDYKWKGAKYPEMVILCYRKIDFAQYIDNL